MPTITIIVLWPTPSNTIPIQNLTVSSFLLFSNSASSALVSCWALDILAVRNTVNDTSKKQYSFVRVKILTNLNWVKVVKIYWWAPHLAGSLDDRPLLLALLPNQRLWGDHRSQISVGNFLAWSTKKNLASKIIICKNLILSIYMLIASCIHALHLLDAEYDICWSVLKLECII